MPRDTQNVSEVVQEKGFEHALLAGIESPYLAAKEQRTEHTVSIHLHLGVDGQDGTDTFCQAGHGLCCFANLLVKFDIQGRLLEMFLEMLELRFGSPRLPRL